MSDDTAGRDKRRRPLGFAPWRPRADTERVLGQVAQVLDTYRDFAPLTVRQVFYALVGGYGYAKTEAAYSRLGDILNRARRAGVVPFDVIRDDGVVTMSADYFTDPADFWDATAYRIRGYRRDRQAGQPCYIELWSEAAGMLPQLDRVAQDYSVPVYSCGGFASLTATYAIASRAVERTGPTVLLHVGDHDPSGAAIFERVTADAAAFTRDRRIVQTSRIEGVRVALTAAQVAGYGLPTAPVKATDSRAKDWRGGTCQLEALPPDALADLVRAAIEELRNPDTLARVVRAEEADRDALYRGLPAGADG